jgi:hypothetical protein
METPKEPENYPTDPDECRTMNFPPEMPQEPETFSSDSDEHRGKKMLPGISVFKGETLPKPKQVSKEAAQLIAAANDASIRAAIAKKAAGYGFCSGEIAEAAAEDAVAARDAVKAAGIIEQKSGRSNGLMSGIDAAYRVLVEQGRSMRAKEILQIATENQYCELHGFTPDATISAAMETEIKRKGDASRFVKIGKGLFIAR